MEKQKIVKINKFIPELDSTICKIEYPFEDRDYYLVEFSLYESLGEWGEYYTEIYDELPNEEEMINKIKEHLKEEKENLQNSILSAREERYLEVLDKISKGYKFKPIL